MWLIDWHAPSRTRCNFTEHEAFGFSSKQKCQHQIERNDKNLNNFGDFSHCNEFPHETHLFIDFAIFSGHKHAAFDSTTRLAFFFWLFCKHFDKMQLGWWGKCPIKPTEKLYTHINIHQWMVGRVGKKCERKRSDESKVNLLPVYKHSGKAARKLRRQKHRFASCIYHLI